jgi:flagellar hook-associated protein FlgK
VFYDPDTKLYYQVTNGTGRTVVSVDDAIAAGFVTEIGERYSEFSGDFVSGKFYNVNDVFYDPDTELYYRVTDIGGMSETSVADAISGGFVSLIGERYSEFTGDFESGKFYNVGEVFYDPNLQMYYKVTNLITSSTSVNDAISNGDVERLGDSYGEWKLPTLDGSNLLRFAKALEDPQRWGRALDFGGSTFEYLMFLSDRLGTGIKNLEDNFDMIMDTVNTLLDNRDAISGVSETEEGINMLTYQKWFNASARLMTTLDDALDTIINRMGRVGL